ncbi:ABC transporter ATP-binding protein [bacterium]|nr:ABC transporter ATP-binding protein [bacterium]
MSKSIAIDIEALGKRYRLGETVDLARNFRETLMGLPRYFKHKAARATKRLAQQISGAAEAGAAARRDEFWALQDINLQIAEGEVIGIIGRNGAGKSTLLKILSRITPPTTGRAQITGRLSSLLEVGTGFHPELTGRENIFLNGAILGMRKAEITRKFDEIVAFAETEKFLDTPVKRYSSGMRVRLAFAVAAHLEPEILVIDEVIAVGDFDFQIKCIRRMQHLANEGRTVLFVSHNMGVLRHFCRTGVVLVQGRVAFVGPIEDAVDRYVSSAHADHHEDIDLTAHPNRLPGAKPVFTKMRTLVEGRPGTITSMGGPIDFEVDYESPRPLRGFRIGVIIRDLNEQVIVNFSPSHQCPDKLNEAPAKGTIRCHIPAFNLMAGTYRVEIGCADNDGELDRIPDVSEMTIIEKDVFGTGRIPNQHHGIIYLPSQWSTSWETAWTPCRL